MKRLFPYIRPHIGAVIAGVVFLFIQAICELTLPNLMSQIVDVGILQSSRDGGAYIWQVGLQMLLVTLASAGAAILVGFFASRTSAAVARAIRADVFKKVESFSAAEFDRFSTASLITRTTNDVTQVQILIVMALRMMCFAPIMGIGGVIMALGKSPSLSWIIVVAVILVLGVVLLVYLAALPKFKVVQKQVDRLNLVTRESLTGMLVVRAFGNQKKEEARFEKTNADLTRTNLFINRLMVFLMPFMMLVMNLVSIAIVWVGGHQMMSTGLEVGDMMAFMQYGMHIIMSFLIIAMMFIMVPRAAVSAGRIAEVLQTEPEIRDPETPRPMEKETGCVLEFKNVSFRYSEAEEDALSHISFTARPGETTAIIGSTGSGKSTVVNLIPRFYDVTSGSVRINGVDIREYSLHDLRETIGFVPQKGVLFSGDVAGNIKYGVPDASEEATREAAKTAQALTFIEELDEGFETPIAQGGTNVSGGQRQRLAIARALIKNAPIYVFDDSFSALDFKTDAALRRALQERTRNAAVLIVAQRVSTILQADQILVMDEGRIVGKGTHKELLATCSEYREIAESQLSKEELA